MIKSTIIVAAFWVLRQSPLAAAELAMVGSAKAQSGETAPAGLSAIKPGTNTSFGPLQQIDAGVLNVGYAEAGPADGPAVILLHGWPYDIHCYGRRRTAAGVEGLPGDRALPARLRHDALSLGRNGPQRPAVRAGHRRHQR